MPESDSSLAYVNGANIKCLLIDFSVAKHVSLDSVDDSNFFREGDILRTRAGSPGTVGIVCKMVRPAVLSDNVVMIRAFSKVDHYDLLDFLVSDLGDANIQERVTGSTNSYLILEMDLLMILL